MKKNKKSTKIDEKKSKLQYNRCTLKGEVYKMERLQKVIATSGYTSRRKAEELITKGKVRVNGKVVTNLPIDWDTTFKLWFTDEQAKQEKILVRIENEDIFKVYYNKNKAEYTNKTFYDFKPNREIKRSLTKQARQGNLDAFLLKRYD